MVTIELVTTALAKTALVMTALAMTMMAMIQLMKTASTMMTLTYQVKYAIASIRKSIAASGAMGRRVAKDVTFNSFVNTQGLNK